MEMTFTLTLPRDTASVPVVRHVCRDSLRKLGVADECVSDIELALTEACTNVLAHAMAHEETYSVTIKVNPWACSIEVRDAGEGFENVGQPGPMTNLMAESGRGILLMHALVDSLEFTQIDGDGTSVLLRKTLKLDSGSILHEPSDSRSASR